MTAIAEVDDRIHQVPLVINGKRIFRSSTTAVKQFVCANHDRVLCEYEEASPEHVQVAIQGALAAKSQWESMPFSDRCAIFLKAADLLSAKYRYKVMAATILGQGKNVWQAEIDAAAELADFWRFNCYYAQQIYAQQPEKHAPGTWNRVEYRSLEGFILAISPFNFTAIGGNLAGAPALMGNVVLWKPSNSAILSNYFVYEILEEAGLPPGVIQFIPGPPASIVHEVLAHPDLAGVHFTGSTRVFQDIWSRVGQNIEKYKSYPRLVGETGGKNFHFIHPSAHLENVVHNTVRSAFEYQGQKCSACSRAYVPDTLWPQFRLRLLEEVSKLTVGASFESFCGPVINKEAFDRIACFIELAKSEPNKATILAGGKCDDSKGYFIEPTVILTTDPHFKLIQEEIFGPVLTISVYPAVKYEDQLRQVAGASRYALTGSIFAQDRQAIVLASEILRHAAGNFYINDKSTGAVVGQQPFGGGRQSGTNDKAGSALNLYRWISPRTIKESFIPLADWSYPSNH